MTIFQSRLLSRMLLVSALFIAISFSVIPQALSDTALKSQSGQASYYAKKYHGRKTASGEKFDQNALLAAHRSWPFGTVVRVTNLENDRSVKVRIVDRLGKKARSMIDLSHKAANALGFLKTGQGVAKVKVDVLQWGKK